MNDYHLIAAGVTAGLALILASRGHQRRQKDRLHKKVCGIIGSKWVHEKDVRRRLAEIGVVLGYAEFHILMNEMELEYLVVGMDCSEPVTHGNPVPRKFRNYPLPPRI